MNWRREFWSKLDWGSLLAGLGYAFVFGLLASIFVFGQHEPVSASTSVIFAACTCVLLLAIWVAYAWGWASGTMKESERHRAISRMEHPDWYDENGKFIEPIGYDDDGNAIWPKERRRAKQP